MFRILFLTIFFLITSVVSADEKINFKDVFSCEKDYSKDNLIEKVQDSYRDVSGLKADFYQSSKLMGMAESITSSGDLKFMKPGKMRWNYKAPKSQDFITDGATVWYYESDVNQVTIGSLNKTFSSDMPVSFLLGLGDLSETFKLEKTCKNENGILMFLSPVSSDHGIKEFVLLVSSKDFIPNGARLIDVADTITEFVFKNTDTTKTFPEEEFLFDPPSGVDVVYHN